MPGAWRTKQPSSGDYYGSVGDASAFRDPRYDYAASYDKKADYDAVEISTGPGYDRLNSNQPVFPPLEDRQVLAGGESRKRVSQLSINRGFLEYELNSYNNFVHN